MRMSYIFLNLFPTKITQHNDLKQKMNIISSPLLSLSNRTNILLVLSSGVSGLGFVKAAATLIL